MSANCGKDSRMVPAKNDKERETGTNAKRANAKRANAKRGRSCVPVLSSCFVLVPQRVPLHGYETGL